MKHKDHHLQLSNKCSSVPNGKVSIHGSSVTTMHHLVHASLTSQTFCMWEQFIYNAIHFSWNTRYETVMLQAVWEHILNIKCTDFLSFIRINILKAVQNLTPYRTYYNQMEIIFSYASILSFLPTVELLWMFFSHYMESVGNWSILAGKKKTINLL